MNSVFITLFASTLVYFAISSRLKSYISLIAIQGGLLFVIALVELKGLNTANLIFILMETLVIKAFVLPYFLTVIISKNNITREAEPYISNFLSLIAVVAGIVVSYSLAYSLPNPAFNAVYFSASLSAVYTGIFIIVTRRKIITHVMGFMVLENGLFLLALAVGGEMPIIINAGILLDIFTSVLALGMFVNEIGNVFHHVEVQKLSRLHD